MEEVIEVENVVTRDCRRVIHLMSNGDFEEETLASYGLLKLGEEAKVNATFESGVHHLRVEWAYQGPLALTVEGWKQAKTMVAWSFEGCMNVTEALMHASNMFVGLFGQKPAYGFVRRLPSGVENGRETGPLMVFEAEWMLERAVAVW
jgi:hypothetical protein